MSAPSNPAQGALPKRRLLQNPPHWTTVLAVAVLLAVIVMALFAPQIANFEPTKAQCRNAVEARFRDLLARHGLLRS
ncbi:hypothetical protein BTHI11S_02064 [Bosea thiooxidans]